MTKPAGLDNWSPSTAQRKLRDAVARGFGVSPHLILGRSRQRPVVRARQAASWVIRQHCTGLSWAQVGRVMGGRDHATVMYAVREAENQRTLDPDFRDKTDRLLRGEMIPAVRLLEATTPRRVYTPRPAEPSSPLAPRTGTWCAQCDALVGAERARTCDSRWCSLKASA